jgi:predicted nucleic acid-binding protein
LRVVVDSNLLIALASGDERSAEVERRFADWIESEADLHAPGLVWYEVASGLAQLVFDKKMHRDAVSDAIDGLRDLPVIVHPLVDRLRPVEIAIRLKSRKAYDAAYLALAEHLQAELWTLDGKLFRNASPLGFPVRLVVDEPPAE